MYVSYIHDSRVEMKREIGFGAITYGVGGGKVEEQNSSGDLPLATSNACNTVRYGIMHPK
jgi:hypothetical protein